jgi:hypothetical protein
MKVLTCATVYVDNDFSRELVKLWWRLYRHLNPGGDILMLDAPGPFDPAQFLDSPPHIFRFDENVGALTRGGKDGAGRGFCKSIELAAAGGYDYVAVFETDFIFSRPIKPIFERMAKAGVKVSSLGFASPYSFFEWGIVFLDVKYAVENRIAERYDWQRSPVRPIVEMRLENLFGDDLWILPMRGRRNEDNAVNYGNISNMFPYKTCQWLTHVSDTNVYHRMLELDGVHLP